MKLSLCMNLFPYKGMEYAVKEVAKIGYQGIEAWGGRPHLYLDDHTLQEKKDLKKLIEDLGMKVTNFLPPVYKYPVNIMSYRESIRKDSMEFMKKNIQNAALIGSPSCCLSLLFPDDESTREESYERLIKGYTELGKTAKDEGINLLIETSPPADCCFLIMVDDGLKLIQETGIKDVFGFVLDVGHLAVNKENFEETFKKLQGIPKHIHMDDNDLTADSHLIPGVGDIDIQSFVDASIKYGYDGYYSAEIMGKYTHDPIPAAKACYENMSKYFVK